MRLLLVAESVRICKAVNLSMRSMDPWHCGQRQIAGEEIVGIGLGESGRSAVSKRFRQRGNKALRRRLARNQRTECGQSPVAERGGETVAETLQRSLSSTFVCCHGHNPSSGRSLSHLRHPPVDDWKWQRDECSGRDSSAHAVVRQREVSHRLPNPRGKANEGMSETPALRPKAEECP